ncbi:hypothetical protein VDG1235_2545 [Verrucomicrobiia bacterium DG1235]|nr:hypothetical protein VDG1235_2545 [Verrucomicrobiae bacterium DG1235]
MNNLTAILALICIVEAGYIAYSGIASPVSKNGNNSWHVELSSDSYLTFEYPEKEMIAEVTGDENGISLLGLKIDGHSVSASIYDDHSSVVTQLKNGTMIRDTNGDGIPDSKAAPKDGNGFLCYKLIDTIWDQDCDER